jgi:hypothetical protein
LLIVFRLYESEGRLHCMAKPVLLKSKYRIA